MSKIKRNICDDKTPEGLFVSQEKTEESCVWINPYTMASIIYWRSAPIYD